MHSLQACHFLSIAKGFFGKYIKIWIRARLLAPFLIYQIRAGRNFCA
jgi:hypothetical protein